eukprot:12469348-Ditylum_brightwellii.AAC.1
MGRKQQVVVLERGDAKEIISIPELNGSGPKKYLSCHRSTPTNLTPDNNSWFSPITPHEISDMASSSKIVHLIASLITQSALFGQHPSPSCSGIALDHFIQEGLWYKDKEVIKDGFRHLVGKSCHSMGTAI